MALLPTSRRIPAGVVNFEHAFVPLPPFSLYGHSYGDHSQCKGRKLRIHRVPCICEGLQLNYNNLHSILSWENSSKSFSNELFPIQW